VATEGYRFVRVLLPEELAQKCDAYRKEHQMGWDALATEALRNLVDRVKGPRRRPAKRGGAT
jgi:hypothetical protein